MCCFFSHALLDQNVNEMIHWSYGRAWYTDWLCLIQVLDGRIVSAKKTKKVEDQQRLTGRERITRNGNAAKFVLMKESKRNSLEKEIEYK